ncbi:PREDICTED: uncharacterized protein LOC106821128 [Priapulus caudatus]|uniref:Uncharacterized protein LOC106821128 n=1 Tax=Priapulus caudatus TaxID=37621 RepID=A0ABM1FA25_PRICU|nr:PREDICTED: uncharacterized protein LOC106821128 [Priapulus caudatus]
MKEMECITSSYNETFYNEKRTRRKARTMSAQPDKNRRWLSTPQRCHSEVFPLDRHARCFDFAVDHYQRSETGFNDACDPAMLSSSHNPTSVTGLHPTLIRYHHNQQADNGKVIYTLLWQKAILHDRWELADTFDIPRNLGNSSSSLGAASSERVSQISWGMQSLGTDASTTSPPSKRASTVTIPSPTLSSPLHPERKPSFVAWEKPQVEQPVLVDDMATEAQCSEDVDLPPLVETALPSTSPIEELIEAQGSNFTPPPTDTTGAGDNGDVVTYGPAPNLITTGCDEETVVANNTNQEQEHEEREQDDVSEDKVEVEEVKKTKEPLENKQRRWRNIMLQNPYLSRYAVQTESVPLASKNTVVNFGGGDAYSWTSASGFEQSSRYTLPLDLKELEEVAPLDYLKLHCKVKIVKESHLHKFFLKKKSRDGFIHGKHVEQAIADVYKGVAMPIALALQFAGWQENAVLDSRAFTVLCILAERIHTCLSSKRGVRNDQDALESADFGALKWKLQGLDIPSPVATLLHAIGGGDFSQPPTTAE